MPKTLSLFLVTLLLLQSCGFRKENFNPEPKAQVTEQYIQKLPSPFQALTATERQSEWGKEVYIATAFASELDLYNALTSYRRALFLIPKEEQYRTRALEIQYGILLCYYYGQKYEETIIAFEMSPLNALTPAFPAFSDVITILYDSYKHMEEDDKAERLLHLLKKASPKKSKDLELSEALLEGNVETAMLLSDNNEYISTSLKQYSDQKKSIQKAKTLNAIFPGAGYYYVGQKKSALTSLFINSLFIAAAYHFFDKGHTAAGIVTTSFEFGWYMGGINGAGMAAEEYNEKLYRSLITKEMQSNHLFPVLMLHYGF